jgi:hypothetical protein
VPLCCVARSLEISSVESSIMACSDGDLLRVVPTMIALESLPLGESQVVEVVGDELKAPKANSFAKGEATTH